jgi:REP element-mobilizing transposase RayT
MSRPLRIEFPGAVYHVTARGDRREPIFEGDYDRVSLLRVLEQALDRFDAQCLAYCLMGNHYHFVLYTRRANLSQLMRQVNGVYTQVYNRRHAKVGHLFQGRFKAILVDRDAYLLSLCRYVERNPVATGLVAQAPDWPWSSCRAHLGVLKPDPWLDSMGLWGYMLGRPVETTADVQQACALYAELIATPEEVRLWEIGLRNQIYLGDEAFVSRMQALAAPSHAAAKEVPRAQRSSPPRDLAAWLALHETREQALWMAARHGGITMTAMAQELGLSVSRVSRLIARAKTARTDGKEAKGKT